MAAFEFEVTSSSSVKLGQVTADQIKGLILYAGDSTVIVYDENRPYGDNAEHRLRVVEVDGKALTLAEAVSRIKTLVG